MELTLKKTETGYELVITKSVTEALTFASLDEAIAKLKELEAATT